MAKHIGAVPPGAEASAPHAGANPPATAAGGREILERTKAGTGHLAFQKTTKDTREFRTWFRGEHTNYNPTLARLIDPDAVHEFVLHGWAPAAPAIGRDTQVTAFGSCFAANISEWLSARRYRVLNKAPDARHAYVVACGEGMVNSFVIRQQFEWAWEDRRFDLPLWHGYDARDYGYDPAVQAETRRIFDETDVFILTFGLSEVWYDEPTGEVFWRTIPKDVYDPARHRFRVSTVEENKDNLRAIYRLIRRHRPQAKVIFTLSPIPLIATFRDNSCITSNAVSKAVLRVAIDEVLREVRDEGVLHYWPSYELVTDVFRSPYRPDRRHPEKEVLAYIMTLFEHVWCDGTDLPRPSLTLAWARACAVSGLLPQALAEAIRSGKRRRVRLAGASADTGDARLDAALRALADRIQQEMQAEAPEVAGPEPVPEPDEAEGDARAAQ
ncbi:MAG: GSCFA domain-containing protein [Rhodobacteraceae bacterium]|nr:GSCFA domain-containing protein [Paracoccaceae bacterium]